MKARIIDGRKLAQDIKLQVTSEVNKLKAKGIKPGLAVVLVGNNSASAIYVHNKIKACHQVGIESTLKQYSQDISQEALIQHIKQLNDNPDIHGILVQLPLPKHIHADHIVECIHPNKDVDGLHLINVGGLTMGLPGFLHPCTPQACLYMLEDINYPLRGKHAVIVGRSDIVGKPMALLLLQKNATVTICHSATQALTQQTRQADVLVSAVGKPKMITKEMVKPGSIVIDVGIHRLSGGGICGDVDFTEVSQIASYITPVPGGVGPMTIAMLLRNTIQAARQQLDLSY